MTGYDLSDCPDLTGWAGDHRPDHPATLDPRLLRRELLDAVKEGLDAHPRSQQKEIGASEIGHPCPRWLAYKFADTPPAGLQAPKWAAAVGTAVHDHFSDWLHRWNAEHEFRYLTDVRVWVGDLLPGRPITSCFDAFDTWTRTLIDLKCPGPTGMKSYAGTKPENPQYEVQFDLYGNGIVNGGIPVAHVGSLRLPRAGQLADAIWRVHPHNPDRGKQALLRAGAIAQMVNALGSAAIPMQPAVEHYCSTCPWFAPGATDLTQGCPGAATFRDRRTQPPADLLGLAGTSKATDPGPAPARPPGPPADLLGLAGTPAPTAARPQSPPVTADPALAAL